MGEEGNCSDRPSGQDYDVNALLKYDGPSLRQASPLDQGVNLFDFCSSDKNERNVSILLSSQGIPFYILRPPAGWRGTKSRMILNVPIAQQKQALNLLYAAAEAEAVEVVPPEEGFTQY